MSIKKIDKLDVPGGGQVSKDHFPYQCAVALASCLGVEIVDFPGNHAGYVFPQNGFAEQLCSILDIEKIKESDNGQGEKC